MGFKDKLGKYYSDAYMQKYGDRMTSVSGTILSVKTETKSILGIFNKIRVYLVVKPEAGKQIVKCQYKMNKWFKKPTFIDVNQGHKVIIFGYCEISWTSQSDLLIFDEVKLFPKVLRTLYKKELQLQFLFVILLSFL